MNAKFREFQTGSIGLSVFRELINNLVDLGQFIAGLLGLLAFRLKVFDCGFRNTLQFLEEFEKAFLFRPFLFLPMLIKSGFQNCVLHGFPGLKLAFDAFVDFIRLVHK